ncbi:TonB-dependent receptor [Sphingomonas profundi]|uniref:TonB-dependent receptor n=1 Tax=Alterirhizorhabdus profundi TaxID=2681549 RepID=UPI001E572C29|nr:TonB-dependent receptor [Sphingomonas profundi]
MIDRIGLAGLALLAGGTAMPAAAEEPPPANALAPAQPAGEDEEGVIVVNGQRRLPGAVIGDIAPEVQISPAEIRSYGVSSVAELLNELSPQTGSGQGRGGEAPVVLLNGKRISGLAEIRDIPTEAIQRVDVLPEEVGLKYGYTAAQKVVNIVLRRRFRAITAEGTGSTSTDGGGETGRAEAGLLRIQGNGRFNLNLDYQNSARLLESQRDIVSNPSRRPFDFIGNVAAPGGGEIDPALSAIAGQTVTIAGVPAGAATAAPTLAQFAGRANAANLSDVTRFRTLRPATDSLAINATLSRPILDGVSATVNGSFGATGSDGLRGPPGASLTLPAGSPFSPFADAVALYRYPAGLGGLAQTSAGETAHAGFTLNGAVAKWQWTVTGNYDHAETRTRTETGIDVSAIQARIDAGSAALNPFGPLPASLIAALPADRARAISNTGDVQAIVSGPLFRVPAGTVSTTVKVGGGAIGFDTRSIRSGVERSADLSRRSGTGQINLDVPLTSRRENVLGAIGDLSANANLAVDRLSDFGTLTTYGYGLTWKPRDRLSLIASVTDEDGAPTVQQLGNPQILTPDVRVFDYLRGATVSVAQVSGGNPDLRSDSRRVTKLGLTWKPFAKTDVSLIANYVRSRIRNVIAELPAPTAQIEAAFPDRFVRDADGALVSIDARPVNFAREDREQLRWGFTFSKPLKSSQRLIDEYRKLREAGINPFGGPARPGGGPDGPPGGGRQGGGQGAGQGDGPGGGRQGGGPGGPGGGFGGRGPGGGGGRLQFAVYHTWLFRDDILIRDGVPVLDLLNGAPSGAIGGAPRHRVEAQAGYTNNGFGARLSVNYQSGTTVDGGTAAVANDLRFSSLTTANLRLFANLGQIPSLVRYGWARGLRVSLSVTNLTNQRIDVRDATGATPISYQRDYLDPIGREVRISIRKLFS